MSLIVSPPTNTSAVPVAQAGAFGGAAGPSLKWLWAAIGVLGVSVVALGTTLVVQNAGKSTADAQPLAVAAQPASGMTGVENFQQKPAPALSGNRNIAMNSAANQPPAASQGYAGQAPQQYQQQQPPLRTAAQAPVCATCGRVESVQAVQQAAPATGVGAVAGGVLGAVVGNQVGKGSGRTAATVLGAVGGGYVGHKVEERTRTQTVYQIAVRMEDGSVRRFTRAQPPAVGTPVVLQGKGFRVDDGAAMRAEEPYPRAQPGAVRVADTY
ncbi:glycine zipper 2TM domain-containing protein [Acidovorax sp. ACV01]|uniref:glycine zipper 2TM domain-containing protein n=1 Tax=Acidovorax sp. ACV01 TaxID=2769311 RepID=UPI001CE1C580|nr:glycine zipper 2TM domain-containing protein [Acidovorax sp. ACV01]